MGYEPPIVSLAVVHAEPALWPEALALADADFDWIHFDVCDGQLAPRLTFGAPVLAFARRWSQAVFEAHVQAARPGSLVTSLIDAGAGVVTIHPEACERPGEVLAAIRGAGARAGLALGPDTPFQQVRRWVAGADLVSVVTSRPDCTGAEFSPDLVGRVRAAREHREREGLRYLIEVDGGVSLACLSAAIEAGADVYVVGAAVLRAHDPKYTLAAFRAAVRREDLSASDDGVTRIEQPPPRIFRPRRAA